MSDPSIRSSDPRSRGVSEAATPRTGKSCRRPHTPGGVGLGQQASREAQRLAAAILEVLAGARTPGQAAEALGVSLPCYFQWETRALQAWVAGCEPRPRGPGRSAEKELVAWQREQERLQRELARQQTLVRLAQRTIGLTPPKAEAAPPSGKGKKRRRRPVVRALQAARKLQTPNAEEAGLCPAPAPSPDNSD